MAQVPLTPLEQSLADLAKSHNFTRVDVGYLGYDPAFAFHAAVWFDDACPGQIGCASGSAPTMALALNEALREVAKKRTAVVDAPITAALPEVA